MSIMGIFYTLQINSWFLRYKKQNLVLVAALCILFLSLSSASSAHAADASWGTAEQKSISYEGKTFSGPNYNKNASGWSPGNDSQRDAIYYQYKAPGSGLLDSEIIWFPKDVDLKTTSAANYSILEKSRFVEPGQMEFASIKSDSTVQLTIGSGVSAPNAAANAMKAVFRNSVTGYANSQCNGRFSDQAQRSECVRGVTTAFESCWSTQTSSVSFATGMNPERPADSISVDNLGFCIASQSGVGQAQRYRALLEGVADDANAKAVDAFTSAIPDGTVADQPTSCAIDGIGWIVCPLSNALALLTDNVFKLVSNLLEVKIFSNTTSNDSLRGAWGTMLSIANVAFVIAFLIIIYSQLTGAGVSNYAMKRMLPRLVVAAVLVNISFWVCAIAVDVSNIIGYSLQNIFMSLSDGLPQNQSIPTWEKVTINIVSGGAITAGVVGLGLVATSPALMWGLLGVLWPLLIGGVFAVLIAMIILTIRQALIVILVVISPLALVAFLLPNTQKWFSKWRDLFITMLLLFPAVSLIFGGSQYAAKIIMSTSPQGAVVIMALAIQVLPLAITPLILKFSGSLMSRIGGMINNPTKGPFDRIKNFGSKRFEGKRDLNRNLETEQRLNNATGTLGGSGGALGGRFSRRRRIAAAVMSRGKTTSINQQQRANFAKAAADESGQIYFAKRTMEDKGFAENIAGDDMAESLKASSQSAVDKIMHQDVASRKILYEADVKIRNKPEVELANALRNNDQVGIRALGEMHKEGGSSGYDNFRDTVQAFLRDESISEESRAASTGIVKKFVADNGKDFIAKDPAMIKFAKSDKGLDEVISSEGSVTRTDEQIAGITGGAMRNAVTSGSIKPEQAYSILSNPQTVKSVSEENQQALRAVIAANGKVSPLKDENPADAIKRLANAAPTVTEIQNGAQTRGQVTPSNPQQPAAQSFNANPQSMPTTGVSIPHNDAPQGYTQTAGGLVIPGPTAKDIKVSVQQQDPSAPNTPAPIRTSEAPTVINNTVNSDQTINQTGNWMEVPATPTAAPSGRRRAPGPVNELDRLNKPSNPRHTTSSSARPLDDPANIPNINDFQ